MESDVIKNMDGSKDESHYLAKVLLENVREQRRARRWSIFFKFVYICVFIGIIFAYSAMLEGSPVMPNLRKPHTALIDIKGVIADGELHEADLISSSLHAAFESEQCKAIILRINSPGGSPVQSAYIFDEIMRLRQKNTDKKVYAVFSDIGASGAYYIAAAADAIYASPASIIGSIGVIRFGFGVEKLVNNLGLEPRIKTAGKYKFMGSPFKAETPEEEAIENEMLQGVHQQFIDAVKKGRGQKLKDNPDLFSGRVWLGTQALELGLIDGLGSAGFVAREVIKVDDIVDYTVTPSFLEKFAGHFQSGVREGIINIMQGTKVMY